MWSVQGKTIKEVSIIVPWTFYWLTYSDPFCQYWTRKVLKRLFLTWLIRFKMICTHESHSTYFPSTRCISLPEGHSRVYSIRDNLYPRSAMFPKQNQHFTYCWQSAPRSKFDCPFLSLSFFLSNSYQMLCSTYINDFYEWHIYYVYINIYIYIVERKTLSVVYTFFHKFE